jgi:hypothetical protein
MHVYSLLFKKALSLSDADRARAFATTLASRDPYRGKEGKGCDEEGGMLMLMVMVMVVVMAMVVMKVMVVIMMMMMVIIMIMTIIKNGWMKHKRSMIQDKK